MKRKVLLSVLCAVCILATSCMKDDSDFEAVKADGFEFTIGEGLSFGIPVGSASLNMGQLLGKWQNTTAIIQFDEETDLLTIVYDSTITRDEKINSRHTIESSGDDDLGIIDTVYMFPITGAVGIDIFNNMEDVVDKLQVEGISADMNVNLRAIASANASNIASQYIRDPYIDSLKLNAIEANNAVVPLELKVDVDTIKFDLDKMANTEGTDIHIQDAGVLDEIVNNRPKQLQYKMYICVPVYIDDEATLNTIGNKKNLDSIMGNVIHIDSLLTRTHIQANFPLRISCNELIYSGEAMTNIDLSEIKNVISNIDKTIHNGDFRIGIRYQNSLPMQIITEDYLVQADGIKPLKVNGDTVRLFQKGFVIPAADLTDTMIDGEKIYHSQGMKETHMLAPLTTEQINSLNAYSGLKIKFQLDTPGKVNASGKKEHTVSFRQSDMLKLSIYLLVNPSQEKLDWYESADNKYKAQ